jgi:hypothetical protein
MSSFRDLQKKYFRFARDPGTSALANVCRRNSSSPRVFAQRVEGAASLKTLNLEPASQWPIHSSFK